MKIFVLIIILTLLLVSCSANISTSGSENNPNQADMSYEDMSEIEQEDIPSSDVPTNTEGDDTTEQAENTSGTITLVKTATIENGSHDVSATINLYSDNTLELLNVNYDGAAPDTFIALGDIGENGVFNKVTTVGSRIAGKLEDKSYKFELADNVEFSAVSLYCDAYSIDFGSAELVEVSE